MKRVLTTVLCLLALMAWSTQPAQAKGKPDRGEIARRVLTSSDPVAAANALQGAERTAFQEALDKDLTVVPAESYTSAMTAEQAAAAGVSNARLTAGGCWYNYQASYITGWGITIGRIWMQLNWCGNGSRVTSYNANPYGCMGQYGFSCTADPVSFRDVGWEVRALGLYRFTIAWGSSTKCAQIRGGASGLYSTRMDCVL